MAIFHKLRVRFERERGWGVERGLGVTYSYKHMGYTCDEPGADMNLTITITLWWPFRLSFNWKRL